MKLTRTALFLTLATAFQIVVLTGMVTLAHLPLWTGTEIRVEARLADPRSLFRGNYAGLHYTFGTIPKDALAEGLRKGEAVYITLEKNGSGIHVFSAAALEPPSDKIFLRERIANHYRPYQVKFGIEAYFAPEEKAQKLEKELRRGGVAILMVNKRGKAAVKAVSPVPVQSGDQDSPPNEWNTVPGIRVWTAILARF